MEIIVSVVTRDLQAPGKPSWWALLTLFGTILEKHIGDYHFCLFVVKFIVINEKFTEILIFTLIRVE